MTFKSVPLPEIILSLSPNRSKRTHGNDKVDLIVVHTPEGAYENMIPFLCRASSRVSYHVLVREDGKQATQLVPWHDKAWHALVHNSRSEGIAIAGFAAKTRALSPAGRATARLVAYRLLRRGLPPVWRSQGEVGGGFCRHADLQTDRRDPMSRSRWLTFVFLVKMEYRFGKFRKSYGTGVPR